MSEGTNDWNIYFDIKGNKTKKIENIQKWQKISHFPGCWYIGRKDFLWRGIHKIKRVHP
jgi:tubulin polyglutamylase TTLL4